MQTSACLTVCPTFAGHRKNAESTATGVPAGHSGPRDSDSDSEADTDGVFGRAVTETAPTPAPEKYSLAGLKGELRQVDVRMALHGDEIWVAFLLGLI